MMKKQNKTTINDLLIECGAHAEYNAEYTGGWPNFKI
jgi:hypothetical protein